MRPTKNLLPLIICESLHPIPDFVSQGCLLVEEPGIAFGIFTVYCFLYSYCEICCVRLVGCDLS